MERGLNIIPRKYVSSDNLASLNNNLAKIHVSIISENEESSNDSNVYIVDISGNDSPKRKNAITDFELIYVLGKGSYAKVVKARNIFTNKFYALKIIDKKFVAKVKIAGT